MPRVHRVITRASKFTRSCRGCSQPIEVGQEVYNWKQRFGSTQYRHVTCGYPKPSELSNRKTAVIEDAIQDIDLSHWADAEELLTAAGDDATSVELPVDVIRDALADVASEAESVGEEYQSGADNMPESLQYGSQAEAMREVAGELQEWAGRLQDFDPSLSDVDLPDRPDREDAEDDEEHETAMQDWREEAVSVIEAAIEEAAGEANDLLGEMPEYQG